MIVSAERIIAWIAFRNQRFEAITQDEISDLVNNGVMQLKHMRGARIPREGLLAEARTLGLFHLGEIKRLYIEANGSFTLIKEVTPKPGLSVIPLWDRDFAQEQKHVADVFVCNNCGNPEQTTRRPGFACSNCDDNNWVQAITK
ncbi:DUF421 domain-containing protein [Spirosoma taeanense]|uniref:DUF421 domain-containing protein n=1 Tax=Spirosoma taeanense TaxID=2735870 RepID=A0A6M5Y8F8_9BACT|nr:YetF domain-containing protein [Spirosoma taeanense]QJW89540.1 DUF421 domain-containing protein [Spirosoma taeanense]